ncbi:MAG: CHAT domain-containing tetratricopeptide repeat protein, partial [Coleofasciculus chthonoplastes F3-SA18-01]|uniref:CHAT domain-containing protein n=1 Tax=Coleofasciculus chthonoplastes TaxID=64178 RepID=UPI0033009F42
NNLGAAYSNRIRGERWQNLEQAITCYQSALQVRKKETFPEQWATTQNNLGAAYSNRISGRRLESIEKAIACYKAALEVYSYTDFPYEWATTQNNLGNAYRQRIEGQRPENLEQAITCYKAALEVHSYTNFPYEWATTQNNLGTVFRERIKDQRSQNIESAIKFYENTLEVYKPETFPEEWAMTQTNLGSAYADRIRGERSENLEKAIGCYQAALNKVYTPENFPQDWARTQNNMGTVYWGRLLGEAEDNIEKAIACYQAALIIYTFESFPEEWAITTNNLGNAFSMRIKGERSQNIEQAINIYKEALKIRNYCDFPEDWATTHNNLGNAYSDRLIGDQDENVASAILYYQAALKVFVRDSFPEQWAMTKNNLGNAYGKLIQGNRGDYLELAIACYRAALEVRTPSAFPLDCLQSGRGLGDLGYNLQNWEIAIEGYNQAILAIEQSRYWATSEATKRELIANSLDIYQKMVQACINHQDYAQALLTVERSKSRTLIELLDSAHLYPKNATDAQKQRISDLRRQIAIYQQQLAFTPSDTLTPATEKHPNQPSPETLIRQQLQAANQQFQDLLTELDDPNFTLTQQVPAQLPDLRRLLLPQTALIEWYLPTEADSGFYAFLVTRRDEQIQITPHHFSAEDREHLDQALLDYRSDYGQDTWKKQLPQRLETLSAALQLPRLLTELSQIQHLILIPHRELHLIPLHALPVSLPSPSRSEAKPLQDWFPVQYAPSCQILNNLQQRPPLEEPSTSFFALQNPTQDLTYADFEVEVLRRLFNPQRVLSHDEATKTALEQPQNRAFLQQSRYVHFSCHGEFSEAEPLNAYLRLANREKLTFQNIFTSLDIPNCRLLILSACKTGLVETPPTDDYVGLASAFFFAGTRTVVGSLWEAEEFSAALLMIRLYQELPRYTSVVMALRAAQDWLRTISRDGVLTWLRDELKLEDSELKTCEKQLKLFNKKSPFTSARYWAPFTISGQLDRTGTSPQPHQS